MSWNRSSVGVVWKCWAGKVEVSPTGLIWEEHDAESSSDGTHTHTKITITHNYSLNTVGKGALYLHVLAQHSAVPLIATLLLMHSAFCTSWHILLRHAEACLLYSSALEIEWIQNWKALKMAAHKQFFFLGFFICSICRAYPLAAFQIELTLSCLEFCPVGLFFQTSRIQWCVVIESWQDFDSHYRYSC